MRFFAQCAQFRAQGAADVAFASRLEDDLNFIQLSNVVNHVLMYLGVNRRRASWRTVKPRVVACVSMDHSKSEKHESVGFIAVPSQARWVQEPRF